MRRIVYKTLVSLPAKLISSGATILGLFGTFASESARKVLGDRMTAENIQYVGVMLLVATLVYVLLLWRLKPEEGEGAGSTTQSLESHGPYSPAVLGNGNQFHFYPPTVEKPPVSPPQITAAERIEQYGRYVDGLGRALGASGAQYKSTPQPDVAMHYFLGRVYKKCGKPPEDGRLKFAYYKRVDREIQDAVVLNKLSTWGYYADTAIRPIGCHVWQNAVLDHRKKTLSIPSDAVRPMVMKDLRFNKEQVDDIWPK